ncbi:MAG: thiosulfate sulfurtransferase GlpE [Oceanospirillales bacterium]|jgi:thiosulfate sulfurtransferase|nr:MAG: thiosulfate sulfurtransferase GlpE [Oceanospirillales bacterium]
MNEFKHLSVNDAVTLIDEGATVVDIRDANSFANSHIKTAHNLNNDNLPVFLQQADRQNPLIVCCYHGISSQSAAGFLIGQGFTDVYSLDGGFEQWRLQFPEHCES